MTDDLVQVLPEPHNDGCPCRVCGPEHALLVRMLDPTWWREEVDVNGEYTTTRARGYYEVVGEIREALSA